MLPVRHMRNKKKKKQFTKLKKIQNLVMTDNALTRQGEWTGIKTKQSLPCKNEEKIQIVKRLAR